MPLLLGWLVRWVCVVFVDRVALGLLSSRVSCLLVDGVVEECGVREKRRRGLPARVVVYCVLAMCLFASVSYEEVMRRLVSGLPGWQGVWVPNRSSLCRARRRLGSDVMRVLFSRLAGPVGGVGVPGVWWRGRRVMALDATLWDVPDTAANAVFGRVTGGPDGAVVGYPMARTMALAECGTRAIVDATHGGYLDGETDLAALLVRSVESDMIVIADRGIQSLKLFQSWQSAGAAFLVRVPNHVGRKVVEALGDGTYLTKYGAYGGGAKNPRRDAMRLRVIEYRVDAGDPIRLITNLTDPDQAPAIELAALYSQRWEIETAFGDLKTRQRGRDTVLRSQDPGGVEQEIWAHLIVYNALRDLICTTAGKHDLDPDRISFTKALNITRRSITEQAGFSPHQTGQSPQPRRPRTHPTPTTPTPQQIPPTNPQTQIP